MQILNEIIATLPEGDVVDIGIGAHWTGVVLRKQNGLQCGLASNAHKNDLQITQLSAELEALKSGATAGELCMLSNRHSSPLASVGLAAINALLEPQPDTWEDMNAGEVIAHHGAGKQVALVGHFPFVEELRTQVGELHVLELRPQEGDLHTDRAPDVIPQAAVVAITSMAFVNGTMDGLLSLCSPEALVIVLGPSTPLSPKLFDYGVHLLCGSFVTQIEPVMEAVKAGFGFQQIKTYGVRLVAARKSWTPI